MQAADLNTKKIAGCSVDRKWLNSVLSHSKIMYLQCHLQCDHRLMWIVSVSIVVDRLWDVILRYFATTHNVAHEWSWWFMCTSYELTSRIFPICFMLSVNMPLIHSIQVALSCFFDISNVNDLIRECKQINFHEHTTRFTHSMWFQVVARRVTYFYFDWMTGNSINNNITSTRTLFLRSRTWHR